MRTLVLALLLTLAATAATDCSSDVGGCAVEALPTVEAAGNAEKEDKDDRIDDALELMSRLPSLDHDVCGEYVSTTPQTLTNEWCMTQCDWLLTSGHADPTADYTFAGRCAHAHYTMQNGRTKPDEPYFDKWIHGYSDGLSHVGLLDNLRADTPALCQLLCQLHNECARWIWVAVSNNAHTCALKSQSMVDGALTLNPSGQYCHPDMLTLCSLGQRQCLSCDNQNRCVWSSDNHVAGWKYNQEIDSCNPIISTEDSTSTFPSRISTLSQPSSESTRGSTTASESTSTTTHTDSKAETKSTEMISSKFTTHSEQTSTETTTPRGGESTTLYVFTSQKASVLMTHMPDSAETSTPAMTPTDNDRTPTTDTPSSFMTDPTKGKVTSAEATSPQSTVSMSTGDSRSSEVVLTLEKATSAAKTTIDDMTTAKQFTSSASRITILESDDTSTGDRDLQTYSDLRSDNTSTGDRDLQTYSDLRSDNTSTGDRDLQTYSALRSDDTSTGDRDLQTYSALFSRGLTESELTSTSYRDVQTFASESTVSEDRDLQTHETLAVSVDFGNATQQTNSSARDPQTPLTLFMARVAITAEPSTTEERPARL